MCDSNVNHMAAVAAVGKLTLATETGRAEQVRHIQSPTPAHRH